MALTQTHFLDSECLTLILAQSKTDTVSQLRWQDGVLVPNSVNAFVILGGESLVGGSHERKR